MKKNLISMIAVTIVSILMLNNATAQFITNTSYEKNLSTAQNSEATSGNYFKGDSRVSNNIKLNAVRDFMKRYKDVNNAEWYVTDDGGFIANFTLNSVQNSVAYNSAGNWMHTISRYYEKNMPQDVRAIVKRIYYDYTITGIEEINVPNKDNNIFLVHVQDATRLKILRIYDGEMEIIHDYKRG